MQYLQSCKIGLNYIQLEQCIYHSIFQHNLPCSVQNLFPANLTQSIFKLTRFISIVLAVLISFVPIQIAFAQDTTPGFPEEMPDIFCYTVADGYIQADGSEVTDDFAQDTLAFIDTSTGNTSPTSVDGIIMNIADANSGSEIADIEAIAFAPAGSALYAANGDQLGVLDFNNGDFRALPNSFGTGQGFINGVLSENDFDDVDSLSFDIKQGVLYGVDRNGDPAEEFSPDVLFAIDFTTGAFVPNHFIIDGRSVDFVEIQPIEGLDDIDDIAVDPVAGVMYGIMNSQDDSAGKLVVIDKMNGATLEVGTFQREHTGDIIEDMEGLSFSNDDAVLYGVTGKAYKQKNLLWQIDRNTSLVRQIGSFQDDLTDFESLACLSAAMAIHIDVFTNEEDANEPPGPYIEVGEPVIWTYLVANVGNIPLLNVEVLDDQLLDQNPICVIDRLEPGQSNLDIGVVCEATGVATRGQYQNVATATGTPELFIEQQLTDSDTSHYFGYIPPLVGDHAWYDANFNGRQDKYEVGVNDLEVTITCAGTDQIFGTDDDDVRKQLTANVGHYAFDELNPGECYLDFELVEGYALFTAQDAISSDALDSDVHHNMGRTPTFTVALGDKLIDWDAGLIGEGEAASVGNFIWIDQNNNGLQEAQEPGIEGVGVELYDFNDNLVGQNQSDADGFYLFTLPPGDYYLKFLPPEEYVLTLQNQGADEETDSDAHPETGMTNGLITLLPGENDFSWDVGLCAQPLLEVILTDNDVSVLPGGHITYRLSYRNTGNSDLANVFITEVVPEYTTFDPEKSTPGWTCENNAAGSKCNFFIGPVSGQSNGPTEFDLLFTVIVDSPLGADIDSIQNQIQITDTNACNEELSGTSTVVEETPLIIPTAIEGAENALEPQRTNLLFIPLIGVLQ